MMAKSNNGVYTLVLVGRTGNGKSATGNTILGKKKFTSRISASGVTKSCELQQTVLDGQIINVIDTPGLFDSSVKIEFIGTEILRCIDLAKDGIHAILAVFSVKSRFSDEEASILHSLRSLFGSEIVNYMIVVFTGGDELEDNDETLEDYLGRECPQPLKDIINICGNRMVLFDNKTKNESKRKAQVQELLSLVNMVITQNDGKPYTDELFARIKEVQKGVGTLSSAKEDRLKLEEQMKRTYEDMVKRLTDMVDAKLNATITKLEQKLAEELAARQRIERDAREALTKLGKEIENLKIQLEQAIKERDDLRNNRVGLCPGCPIL